MNITIKRIKQLAIALIALPLLTAVVLNHATVQTGAAAPVDEKATADFYATKCKLCHGVKAEKFFDTVNLTDEQLAEIVLKGKKGEKPPYMPAFEPKGVDADQSKALVAYMKSLRP